MLTYHMICEHCSNEHDGKFASGRFCSRGCACGFATKKNRQEINDGLRKKKFCMKCQKELLGTRKYSSRYCTDCSHKKPYSECSFEELLTDRSKKRRLIEENGIRCMICGITEWTGHPVPLQLDHIDGDSSNSSRENLRVICPNCHALTPTYAGRNVGKATNLARKSGRLKYYKSLRDEI